MKHLYGISPLKLDPRIERILFFDTFRKRFFTKIMVIAEMTELFQHVRHESLKPPYGREYIRSMTNFYENAHIQQLYIKCSI